MVEVTSPVDGVVKEYFIQEYDEVDVDLTTEIVSVEETAGGAASTPAPAAPKPV